MNRLIYRVTAAVAGSLLVALAGCGTSETPTVAKSAVNHSTAASPATNGLESQSAAKVAQAAETAFKAAKSVHVRGTFFTDRRTEKFDLRYEGGSTRGTFTVNGATIQIITVGGTAYLKAGKRGWAAMGNPPGMQGLLVNKWVKSGSARQMLTPFSLTALASELRAEESMHGGTGSVTQSTLAGHKVVVVSYPDGSKLYVANVGAAYPLRFDDTGSVGRRDFSQYGSAFHIIAPPNPV